MPSPPSPGTDPHRRAALVATGIARLSGLREELRAQVPESIPVEPDQVVVWSGHAEIVLGACTFLLWRQPALARIGTFGAAFFLAVLSGNVVQWLERNDGFGLDTDEKRMARLVFQPVLMACSVRPARRSSSRTRRSGWWVEETHLSDDGIDG